MNEQKAELRKAMLEKRDAFPADEKAIKDAELRNRLEQIIYEKDAKVIYAYLPFGSEIDIYPLLELLLQKGNKIICPKALPKRKMQHLVLHSLANIEEGRFGTKHPAGNEEYDGLIDLFIVPGISFNAQNYRLGYGAGYYDTFFSIHPSGFKLGICYPFQVGDFPVEAHDVPLDGVLY